MRVKPALLIYKSANANDAAFRISTESEKEKYSSNTKGKYNYCCCIVVSVHQPIYCIPIPPISALGLNFTNIFINSHGCTIKNAFHIYGRT